MTKDTNLNQVIFNKMSLAKYNELKEAGQLNEDEFYITPDTNDTNNVGLEIGDIILTPFGIDESENKRRYLNGQVILQDQYPQFTNKVKSWQATRPNLFTTETNWQAEKTNSKLGQCGKFVIDDTAGTIRLPAVVNINGLSDLADCGVIKAESLPKFKIVTAEDNVTQGTITAPAGTTLEVAQNKGGINAGTSNFGNTAAVGLNVGTNLTTGNSFIPDNSIYQDNAPVQQEAIQYPYTIVVNTGVEEADRPINNYQINNVYAYGMSQYYKGIMNNNSWLRSNNQWNAGTVYTGIYAWIQEQLTAGTVGFKSSSDTYTDYDFVINTADQTFRLPLKNGQEGIFASGIKGNGNALGLMGLSADLITNYPTVGNTDTKYNIPRYSTVVGTVGSSASGIASPSAVNKYIGITTNASESGIIVDNTVPDGYNLYYYVGNVLENVDLINVARLEEKLVNSIDKTSAIDKEAVINWGIPDWDSAISATDAYIQTNPFVAPSDGLLIYGYWSTATSIKLYVNDIVIGGMFGSGNGYGMAYPLTLPLAKGDKFYQETANNQTFPNANNRFIPFRGVK